MSKGALSVLANSDILSVLHQFASLHNLDAVCKTIKTARSQVAPYVLVYTKTTKFLNDATLRTRLLARMKSPAKQLSLLCVSDEKFPSKFPDSVVDILANTANLRVHAYGGSLVQQMFRSSRASKVVWSSLKELSLAEVARLENTDFFSRCPNLKTLVISRIPVVHLTHLHDLSQLELLSMTVAPAEADDEEEDFAQYLQDNTLYDMDGDPVYPWEYDAFGDMPEMRRRGAGAAQDPELTVAPLKKPLQALKALLLPRCPVSSLAAVFGVDNLPNLEKLSVPYASFRASELCKFINKLPKLHTLCVDERQLGSLVGNFDKIKTLRVDSEPEYADAGEYTNLAKFAHLENLQILDLSFDDLDILAPLKTLKKLDIQNSYVSDLTPLRHLPKLEYLDITSTKVKKLAPLRLVSGLKKLVLGAKTYNYSDLATFAHANNPKVVRDYSASGFLVSID